MVQEFFINNFMVLAKEIIELSDLIAKSKKSFFITGKAGTGKSTLINEIKKKTDKQTAVLASTGVAAVNVEGQTVHSFFGFKPGITVDKIGRVSYNRKIYKKIETLIIDEVSMIRADLFDCIGKFLEINGPKPGEVFGGVQIILVGDLFQLPPVITYDERDSYNKKYETPYFFSSHYFKKLDPEILDLKKIYRQSDNNFIEILNDIRSGMVTDNQLSILNNKGVREITDYKGLIFLTTTNKKADIINFSELNKISGSEIIFDGFVDGDFPESYLPTDKKLKLKKSAKVMLLNNDKDGRWINGDVGEVLEIDKISKVVKVALSNGRVVKVSENKWDRIKYSYNEEKEEIKAEEVGSFSQLPIRLSWATTIHKSQGKTFDKVLIDFESGTFSHGQAYVAISRCRKHNGIYLKRKIRKSDIIVDSRVKDFLNNYKCNH